MKAAGLMRCIGVVLRRCLPVRDGRTAGPALLVRGTDAVWHVDLRSGRVLSLRALSEFSSESAWIYRVTRFDVREYSHWCSAYGLQLPAETDVVAIGYWLVDGSYEEPEPDARVDIIAAHFDTGD